MKKYSPSHLFNDELSLPEIRDMLRSLKKCKTKKSIIWLIFGFLVVCGAAAAVVLKLRSKNNDDLDDDFDDDDFDDFDDDDFDDDDDDDNDDDEVDDDEKKEDSCECSKDNEENVSNE